MKRIVTIDGPAGSGKSTIAKLLANRIGFAYLDTGALYRSISLYFMRKDIKPREIGKIREELPKIQLEISSEFVKTNGEDVSSQIRTDEVTKESPLYAKVSEIREFVKKIQKKIAANEGFVIDGRDIGSVIFPDAFCKFYLDASVKVRAQRRLSDEKSKTEKTLEEVEGEVAERDRLDKSRKDSPLVIPVDAMLIDTSDLKIEEVLDKMIAQYNLNLSLLEGGAKSFSSDKSSSKMFLEAVENVAEKSVEKGGIVKAKIVEFGEDRVLLDLGDKKDGFIQGHEVKKVGRDFKVGDEIMVYVIGSINNHSEILASHQEAIKRESLLKFSKYKEEGTKVRGSVLRLAQEGFVVEVEGVECFCSFSEYDEREKLYYRAEIGKERDFLIKFLGRDRVFLTRKEMATQERASEFSKFFNNHQLGDVVSVKVERILKYGIFVSYSDAVGFVMKNKDLSWKRFENASEILNAADVIQVKIVEFDPERKRVTLSRKELEANPLDSFLVVHQEGEVLEGRVRSFLDFGAFVELEPGVDGLLHISEISWTEKIAHPSEVLKLGDKIQVKLLHLDRNSGRISLGYKQTQGNPWEDLAEEEPIGSLVRLRAKEVTASKVFFENDKSFDYALYRSNFSWADLRTDLTKHFEVGQEYDLKVLRHNRMDNAVELGVKQLQSNPWNRLREDYGEGAKVEATVTRFDENGAFVKLDDCPFEGYCHISRAAKGRVEKIEDAFEIGKRYHFILQKIDEKNNSLVFSAKAYLIWEEKGDIEKYMNRETKNTFSLGDFLNNDGGNKKKP